MMALLFVDDDVQKKSEICDLLSHAGYQITLGQGHASLARLMRNDAHKAVTILQVEHGHPLQVCLESLAGCASRPWRVSLHQRCLVAPNDSSTKLTSLEFTLIKIFATMEKGEVVSRRRIIDEFGEHYLSYDQNRLDTTVMRLRKKAKMQLGMALPLNTVRVRGFSFDDWLLLNH